MSPSLSAGADTRVVRQGREECTLSVSIFTLIKGQRSRQRRARFRSIRSTTREGRKGEDPVPGVFPFRVRTSISESPPVRSARLALD